MKSSEFTTKTIQFSSADTYISVTYENMYEGNGIYQVLARSGHDEFSAQVAIPIIVFSPNDDLAYHKAARDVLLEAISTGKLASVKARWMRHRSGDDGSPMLVLNKIKPVAG